MAIFFESIPQHQMKLKLDETFFFINDTLFEQRVLNKKIFEYFGIISEFICSMFILLKILVIKEPSKNN